MIRNPGHLPRGAANKRVRVILANGNPAGPWAADGNGACRWSRTGSPFDIDYYEVIA
ncbi:MAG: hypothetical protein OSB00_17965 [Sphingomonas bacterium]|nr:hypothetical protein [Sphingomonas bacterium]